MTWRTKLTDNTKRILSDIRDAFLDAGRERLDDIAEEIESYALEQLERTVENWMGGDNVPYAHPNREIYPKPKFDATIKVTGRRGVEILVTTSSPLWKWLDQGTAPHISVGEFFAPRVDLRTTPGTLEVGTPEGVSFDDPVYIPEGNIIRGIPARGWTKQLGVEVETYFEGRFPGLQVTTQFEFS